MKNTVLRVPRLRDILFNFARILALAFSVLLVIPTPSARAQDITLQVDGYTSGQTAGFQGGFVAGEIGAVRLTPPGPFPMQLKEVLFLFGGASGQIQIVLRIYDDSGGTLDPGVELFSNTYLVSASNTVLQSIDLAGDNILINSTVRVGIEMTQGGLPSIARDDDGNINSSLNFIKTALGWVESQTFGMTGDWVVRAVVSDASVPAVPATWGRIKSMHRN